MDREFSGDSAFDRAWRDIPDPAQFARSPAHSAPPVPSAPSLNRSQARRRRSAAMTGAIVWAAAIVILWGLRHDARDVATFLAMQLAIWTTLIVTGLHFALSKGDRGLGKPITRIALVTVAIPLAFVVLALSWQPACGSAWFAETGTLAQFRACFGLGLLVVLPILGLSGWTLRRSFPSASAWRGGLWGAACGLIASTALALHCGIRFGGHIALAHGAPLVLATLAGALIGSRVAKA